MVLYRSIIKYKGILLVIRSKLRTKKKKEKTKKREKWKTTSNQRGTKYFFERVLFSKSRETSRSNARCERSHTTNTVMRLPLRVNVVKRGEYASTTRSVLRSEQCVYLACQSRNHGEHVTGFNAIVGPAYLLIRIASHSYFHHSVSHDILYTWWGRLFFPRSIQRSYVTAGSHA